jgi:uracil-DNA glycosylase family 4
VRAQRFFSAAILPYGRAGSGTVWRPPVTAVSDPSLGPLFASDGRVPGPGSRGTGASAPDGLAALADLAEACDACRRCGLAAGRQQVVVSRGDPQARLMVIGEGPGAQEDASGLPFVGRAGQLLDQMLASVGIDSNRDAYICNVVKCRPPENRKPTPLELAACRPWLWSQIAAVDPAVILLTGASALEGVLGVKGGITQLRGRWQQGKEEPLTGRWLLPIFHPSYLLRNPSKEPNSPKWLTWHDLQDVRRRLDAL